MTVRCVVVSGAQGRPRGEQPSYECIARYLDGRVGERRIGGGDDPTASGFTCCVSRPPVDAPVGGC